MKYIIQIFFATLIIGGTLVFTSSGVHAQTACVQISNLRTAGSIEIGKEFQCLVTADQPNSQNVACGIRVNNASWPENFCPSDTNFGGWNGNVATFNCTLPVRNDLNNNPKLELVAYDFRGGCGPETGKTISISLSSTTPAPTQGSGPTPVPTESGNSNIGNGSSDLKECTGYDIYQLASQIASTTKDPSIIQKIIATYIAACTGGGNGSNNNNNGTPYPTSAVSMAPGTVTGWPANLQEFFTSTKVTDAAKEFLNAATPCAQNMAMYIQAAKIGGLPENLAPILAGIHYIEGSCNPNQSLRNGFQIGTVDPQFGFGANRDCSSQDVGPGTGKPIPIGNGCGFANVLDSAIWATRHFLGKNGTPQKLEDLVYSYGLYNGTGNNNCGKYHYVVAGQYTSCPEKFPGEAHPYGMNKMGTLFSDYANRNWFVLFCRDGQLCTAPVGSFTRPNAALIGLLAWRKYNNAL